VSDFMVKMWRLEKTDDFVERALNGVY
jgi:hypothetical protein